MPNIAQEFVPDDKWVEIRPSNNIIFKLYNPKKAMTVWCKYETKLYKCFINVGLKQIFKKEKEARGWAKEIMTRIGGQQTLFEKFNEIEEQDFSSFGELQSVFSRIRGFMKTFGIGFKIKSFSDEKGATKKIRNILQKWLAKDSEKRPSVGEVKQDMKDELVKYTDGQPNIQDYEIERVARTELSSMRELEKLLSWKAQGYKRVRHNTHVVTSRPGHNSGKKDIEFNGRIFDIEYLLNNPKDRVPLHPNCFVSPTTLIRILEGYKEIRDIKIGDKVLTHKKRFKKVIETKNDYTYDDYLIIKVYLKGKGFQIKVTYEHPILTKRGWILAKDLTENDIIFFNKRFLEDYFEEKKKSHQSKATKKVWKKWEKDGTKEKISEKQSQKNKEIYKDKEKRKSQFLKANEKMRKDVKEGKWHLQKNKGKSYEEIHGKKTEDIIKRIKETCIQTFKNPIIRRFRREKLLEYLKKNKIFSIGRNEKEILDQLAYEYDTEIERQYHICGYRLDGFSKELNIAFEVDEKGHSHYRKKEKDKVRELYIKNKTNCRFVRVMDY